MVKLASAREMRRYGPRPSLNRWEYINAGVHVFAALLLAVGFAAQILAVRSPWGLVVLLVGLVLIAAVNAHDLLAHVAGVDYCLRLAHFDAQLALVEFAVPSLYLLGSLLNFVAVLFFLIQVERGDSYRLEKHAANMLIAGPALWIVGSIHNLCQVYERADGKTQMLQKSVQIPFLLGSLLFLVGGVFNRHEIFSSIHHEILGRSSSWLCICGSILFLVGGLMNVLKVFKMQEVNGLRLEKLRGGAQERLIKEREGKVPLILEESRRMMTAGEGVVPGPTPYKDVLVGSGGGNGSVA